MRICANKGNFVIKEVEIRKAPVPVNKEKMRGMFNLTWRGRVVIAAYCVQRGHKVALVVTEGGGTAAASADRERRVKRRAATH